MLCGTIAYLMEFNTLIHLLMKTLSGRTVGWMERCIVTICTSSAPHFAISVRTGKASIQNYLLEALAIFPLEVAYEGIVSFPIREGVFFISGFHTHKNKHIFPIFVIFRSRGRVKRATRSDQQHAAYQAVTQKACCTATAGI